MFDDIIEDFDIFLEFLTLKFFGLLKLISNVVCLVLMFSWLSIFISLIACHIWEIAVKIEIVAFLEYLVFIYIFIYILYIYYILYSRTIWEKTRYYEIAFIWFFCANCLQREHSSKSREKHKGNNERSKVEQLAMFYWEIQGKSSIFPFCRKVMNFAAKWWKGKMPLKYQYYLWKRILIALIMLIKQRKISREKYKEALMLCDFNF